MNVLITGAEGFIGGVLSQDCIREGASVLGIGIGDPGDGFAGTFEHCDVRDSACLSHVLATFRPERIFHLAAQSYPTVSLIQPRETIDCNVGGTVNLFECLRALKMMPVVVVACSSAEYGPVAADDLPVRETHPLRPLHPYGVSKVAQDLLAAQYFVNYGFPAVRIRIFNTTGPGKEGDVCGDLTRRAVEIELGLRPPILLVGNLTTKRAIVDARDLVRGLWLSTERCKAGDVYNLGGEKIFSVQEVIDAIRITARGKFRVEQDPTLIRSCDEPVIAGDISKFRRCTGWTAKVDLTQTLRDMLDWWRYRLGAPTSPGPLPAPHSEVGAETGS
jgi:GDP-4-dehydro-6-deoxy-D-mannose reductase